MIYSPRFNLHYSAMKSIGLFVFVFFSSQSIADLNKGKSLVESLDYRDAIVEFRKITGAEGNKATPYYRKAIVNLFKVERFVKAFLKESTDFTKDYEWFKKAADNGNRDAQFVLGQMYASGYGIEKNESVSRQWYEKAAAAGDAGANQMIGMMLMLNKQYTEAIVWLEKSVKQGYAEGIANLAWLYAYADDKRDFKKAEDLAEKAARLGHQSSQIGLCLMYQGQPKGFTLDKVKAAVWCSVVAETDRMAKRDFNKLISAFKGAEKEKILQQAQSYKKKFFVANTDNAFMAKEQKNLILQAQQRAKEAKAN